MKRIHLISGPRNISTALMYSFANRPDTKVVDEPFYAYYLKTHPEIDHPGKDETLKSQSTELDSIISEVVFKQYENQVFFIKNMAHHLDGIDWTFLNQLTNVFLIRNPQQLIASFAQVIPNPTMLDIGLELEKDIFDYLLENGTTPIVLDSNHILTDPKTVLGNLCKKIDIPFHESMLKWEAGPIGEDGVWAKYWYANVHKSTGFQKQKTSERPFPSHLGGLLEEAMMHYNYLSQHSIKA